MLTKVRVDSASAIDLNIKNATTKDSLLIRKITGLNPAEVSTFIGEYAADGGTYQGRRVQKRNVVLTIDINPNQALGETVDGLRTKLYKQFYDPSIDSDAVKLKLYDSSDLVRYVIGYTDKTETDPFDQENTCQISMVCPDPYIRNDELTTYADISAYAVLPITYNGTAETGFYMSVKIMAYTPKLIVELDNKLMTLERDFYPGDIVDIDTNRGEKSITLTSPLTGTSSILSSFSESSVWHFLHNKSSVISVYGTSQSDLIGGITTLQFREAYWGI